MLPDALERMMESLAFGPAIDAKDARALNDWLTDLGVDAGDRAAILASDFERLLVYRTLVRDNLREALGCAIPCTMARLGGVFDEYFDRFLRERGPRTHYLRDVTQELLEFCAPLWQNDARVPAYALDLARHEAVQVVVGSRRSGSRGVEPSALDLARGVRFVEAVELMRYDFAVHRLSDDPNDRSEPERVPTGLFVYRNPEHEVRYLELTPLASAIVERLLAGLALGDAVRQACHARGSELDASVITGSARLLSDLAERGALLGSAEPT